LQTGFAGLVSANIRYYNGKEEGAKISTISTSITYSQYNQIIFPLYADIWSKNGKYNFISDNRFISYPSEIFGLGGATDPNQDNTIDFNQIKLHETVLRRVFKDLYLGVGFYYDHYWDIKVITPQTRLVNFYVQGQIGNTATASGPAFKLLYDSRANQINPDKGTFLNVVLRQNLQELGSDDEWASLLIDARKYFNFPRGAKNTLAFWSYNWLTLVGDLNYLLLPSTGWDDQYNTGRGYVQSRFRGKQMFYFETEYRYRISHNGLLGGVVFFNVENFTGNLKPYDTFLPGYGAGLRVKLNKKSGANLCLDYGFGKGSSGFYVNLGEVF
jgi:Omp85 superfamily domain